MTEGRSDGGQEVMQAESSQSVPDSQPDPVPVEYLMADDGLTDDTIQLTRPEPGTIIDL